MLKEFRDIRVLHYMIWKQYLSVLSLIILTLFGAGRLIVSGGISRLKRSFVQYKNLHNVAWRLLFKYKHIEKSYTRGKRCSCNKYERVSNDIIIAHSNLLKLKTIYNPSYNPRTVWGTEGLHLAAVTLLLLQSLRLTIWSSYCVIFM